VGVAFICFWLCGWAAGENFALRALFGGLEKSNELERSAVVTPLFVTLFLVGWLGAWTIGGLSAMGAIYSLLRPARPGRLTLSADQLVYLPPRGAMNPAKWRGVRRRRDFFAGNAAIIIPRQEASEPRLERIEHCLRLTIDRGAKRLVIGETLTEPEIEWLSALLARWKSM
jgi:hypothetical protein